MIVFFKVPCFSPYFSIDNKKKFYNRGWKFTIDIFLLFQHHDHADVLTVGFNVDGVERVLDLRLNTDLIPVGYQQLHQHRGTYKVHTPSKVVSTAWASSIHIRSVLTAFPQTTFALIDIERKRNSIGYQYRSRKASGFIQLNPVLGHSFATRYISNGTQRAALSMFNGIICDVKFTIVLTAVRSLQRKK